MVHTRRYDYLSDMSCQGARLFSANERNDNRNCSSAGTVSASVRSYWPHSSMHAETSEPSLLASGTI